MPSLVCSCGESAQVRDVRQARGDGHWLRGGVANEPLHIRVGAWKGLWIRTERTLFVSASYTISYLSVGTPAQQQCDTRPVAFYSGYSWSE